MNLEKLNNRLQKACKTGDLNSAKEALAHGADIHADYDSALQIACVNGHLDVVKYLLTSPELDEYADIHADDDWALRFACAKGYLDIVQCLIQNGAHFEQFKPLEKWFADYGNDFMLETIEGMKPEMLQPIMEKHGDYVVEKYISECVEIPDNITQYLPDIEHHQEQELYL